MRDLLLGNPFRDLKAFHWMGFLINTKIMEQTPLPCNFVIKATLGDGDLFISRENTFFVVMASLHQSAPGRLHKS